MIQLWFNTAIPWITKPSVEWVKWTQVNNFTQEQKDGIKQQIKNPNIKKVALSPTAPRLASTEMVWITKPRRADEAQVRNLTIELLDSSMQWTWVRAVFDKYKDTLSEDWIKTANFMALDILNGSGSEEIVNAYKKQWLSVEAINTILEINELQKQTYQWIWNIWGGVWEITDEKWNGMWIWKIAWTTAWGIAWAWVVWKVFEEVWKIWYWLTLTNTEQTSQAIANAEESIKELKLEKQRIKSSWVANKKELLKDVDIKIAKIKDTMPEDISSVWLRTKWAYGSLRNIWTTISATAEDIAKKYIEPWLIKATEKLWKIKVNDIFKNVETKIKTLAKTKWEEYAKQVKEAFDDIKWSVFWNKKYVTYQEANATKSWIYDLTTTRLKKWLIDPNTSKMAKDFIGWELVWKISDWLREIDPTLKTLKEYKSYGTRKFAKDISKKAIKSPWIDGALWTVSAVIKAVAAPWTTILWKTLVTVWKWLQYPIKLVAKWIKYIAKSPAGKVMGWLMAVDPTWTLTSIIENEIYTKWLSKQQSSLYTQMRLSWMPSDEAAKYAKESDKDTFTMFY